jgi:hypothetical protein
MMGIREIMYKNREKGFHFFDPSSMRFFESRVGRKTYGKQSNYFITSEQFLYSDPYTGVRQDRPRRYSVRKIDWNTGQIGEGSRFQQFRSSKTAKKYIRKFLRLR